MTGLDLKILPVNLLQSYTKEVDAAVKIVFGTLQDSALSAESFSFYTSVSAVFSSKIEGEDIEFDSFLKHKKLGIRFMPDYTRKTDDLYDAYLLAQSDPLNRNNINETHKLLTRHILQAEQRGALRSSDMFVITGDGKIEYMACAPIHVEAEMEKLYHDIALLINTRLSFIETLFFAAMIHLVFVKIHPFNDGNGRMARLIEKWFIAEKAGAKAWFIQSEKHYYEHHQQYYNNIRLMGLEYERLDYAQAMPFLLMLPRSVK